MMEEHGTLKLVPLYQSLIPASVAQAFALPSLGGTLCVTDHLPSLDSIPSCAPPKPTSATTCGTLTAARPVSTSVPTPVPAAPAPNHQQLPRQWLGAFGGPIQLQQQQQQQQHQQQQQQQQQLAFANTQNPTTSGSSAGPTYGPYPMYVAFPQGAPPPYASALPGVFGHGPFGHFNQVPSQMAGSIDLSAGPSSSGPGQFGVRMGPGMPSIMTESTDDDLGDGTARAVKRARLVWTPQLHKRFEEAVAKLGSEKSIPKNIMQEMNVEGLTRENVASHLQKWRLQKKIGKDGLPEGGDMYAAATSQGTVEAMTTKLQEQHSQE